MPGRQGCYFLAGLLEAVAVIVLLELGTELVEGNEGRSMFGIAVGLVIV